MEKNKVKDGQRLDFHKSICASRNLLEALARVFDTGSRWLGFDLMVVLTEQLEGSGNMEIFFCRGFDVEWDHNERHLITLRGPWNQALAGMEPRIIDFSAEWAPLLECFPVIEQLRDKRVMVQPWRMDADMQGLILISTANGEEPTADKLRAATAMFEDVRMSFKNLIDRQRYRRMVAQFHQIQQVSSAALSHVELDQIIDLVIKSLINEMRYRNAAVYLLNKSDCTLELKREGGDPAELEPGHAVDLKLDRGRMFDVLWNMRTRLFNASLAEVVRGEDTGGEHSCRTPIAAVVPLAPTSGFNRCWEENDCKIEDCPMRGNSELACWLGSRERMAPGDDPSGPAPERLTKCICCPSFKVQGVIAVEWAQEEYRNAGLEDISVLELFASNVAIAVQNAEQYMRLKHLAITDSLTGLYNHRFFHESLKSELDRSVRYGGAVALIMLDLDHFKEYNDTYGHPMGDDVLSQVSEILRRSVRKVDLVARYGGEEFAVMLPETEIEGAEKLAERMRAAIEEHRFPSLNADDGVQITASLGVAEFPTQADSSDDLVSRADEALYMAKARGRNMSVVYSGGDDRQ